MGEIIYQGDKAFVGHSQRTYEPYGCSKYVEWGFSDNSVRLYQTETNKILGIFENVHLEAITGVKWADDRTIVTTSRDTVVCVWRIVQGRSYELKLMKCLRGHRETVHAVAISVAYSIIVSGSEDKSCIIWDLNRLEYVRQLGRHDDGVRVVAINDATGDIATCSGPVLRLWTVNGDMILQKYTTQIGDPILDCVFYSGKTGEWLSREIVLTSHRRGTIKVWEKAVIDAEYQRTTATQTGTGHQQGNRSSTGNNLSISSLQSSVESMPLSTGSPAIIPATVVEENGTDNGSLETGGLSGTTTGLSMSNLSIAAGEDDSLTSGSRTRQSSQVATLTGSNKSKSAKWALRLRQAYTYEDRLRIDGGVIPNIVSLYISRYTNVSVVASLINAICVYICKHCSHTFISFSLFLVHGEHCTVEILLEGFMSGCCPMAVDAHIGCNQAVTRSV